MAYQLAGALLGGPGYDKPDLVRAEVLTEQALAIIDPHADEIPTLIGATAVDVASRARGVAALCPWRLAEGRHTHDMTTGGAFAATSRRTLILSSGRVVCTGF